jgi:hypothetical protein
LASIATPSAMAFSSSTCQSVFPDGSSRNRSGVARAEDFTFAARRFSVITPSAVTRANVRLVGCSDEAAPGAVDPVERAPNPKPPPLEELVTNSARETPATRASRLIEARRLKKVECEAHFFFMDQISDKPTILVLFRNARQHISVIGAAWMKIGSHSTKPSRLHRRCCSRASLTAAKICDGGSRPTGVGDYFSLITDHLGVRDSGVGAAWAEAWVPE